MQTKTPPVHAYQNQQHRELQMWSSVVCYQVKVTNALTVSPYHVCLVFYGVVDQYMDYTKQRQHIMAYDSYGSMVYTKNTGYKLTTSRIQLLTIIIVTKLIRGKPF